MRFTHLPLVAGLLVCCPSVHAVPLVGPVPDELIVTYNGLDWAWAGATATHDEFQSNVLELPGFQEGWRYATDEEFASRPDVTLFLATPGDSSSVRCASAYWNNRITWCDYDTNGLNGQITNVPFDDPGASSPTAADSLFWWETWYVRDAETVPEPMTSALLGLGLAAMGLRRRRLRV